MNFTGKNLFPFIFLFSLSVLFFLPYLITGKIPYAGDFTGSDLTELNLPFRFLVKQSLKEGQLPLWTDLSANGFPILAEGQAGVFYPFNLIFFTFLPFTFAVNLSLLLNFFLAGLFTYWYCRILKISRFGSILAAVSFSFSGFFIFRLKHLNLINAAIWLPLEFYLIEKYFVAKKNHYHWLIFLSLVFACQFFAGHPQISHLSFFISFIYFILRFYSFKDKKQIFKIKPIIFKIVVPWFFLGVLFLGLVAIQLLPTYEFSQLSGRGELMNYENATKFSFPPNHFLTLFYPYFFGNPATASYWGQKFDLSVFWENNVYFGLIPLFLAVFALFFSFRRNPFVKFFFIILLVCLFFILGDFNPLFKLSWSAIPGLKFFRFPQRFLLPFILILAVLAGLGLDLFFTKINNLKRVEKLKKSKIIFLGLPLIIILIVIIDLFFYGFQYLGMLDSNYFKEPASAKFLKQDQDVFRILSFNWQESWAKTYFLSDGWLNNLNLYKEERELLPPNLNFFYGIASADDRGWQEGGQLPKRLAHLWQVLKPQISYDSTNKVFKLSKSFLKIFGLQNVKYLLSFSNLAGEGLEIKEEIKLPSLPALKIYKNKYFLPQAFAVFNYQVINEEKDILKEMINKDFDFNQSLIIEKSIIKKNYGQPVTGIVKINKLNSQLKEMVVDFSADGFLFLSQTYYPGWRAEIDGVPSEILRANTAFSAIAVAAGSHQVKFFFKPQVYKLGCQLTLITLIFIIIFLLVNYFYLRKKL